MPGQVSAHQAARGHQRHSRLRNRIYPEYTQNIPGTGTSCGRGENTRAPPPNTSDGPHGRRVRANCALPGGGPAGPRGGGYRRGGQRSASGAAGARGVGRLRHREPAGGAQPVCGPRAQRRHAVGGPGRRPRRPPPLVGLHSLSVRPLLSPSTPGEIEIENETSLMKDVWTLKKCQK
eukprot:8648226-Pyramimonas_sp.AAC.2